MIQFMFALLIVFTSFEVYSGTSQGHYCPGKDGQGRLKLGEWTKNENTYLKSIIFGASDQSFFLNFNSPQAEQLCAGYQTSLKKRKYFWQQFFVSLAWKESLHHPKNCINFRGGVNCGLYQIDPRLRSSYSCGKIGLYNEKNNISCATKMVEHLISKGNIVFDTVKNNKGKYVHIGAARYWQPLRGSSKYNRNSRRKIKQALTDACKNERINYKSNDELKFTYTSKDYKDFLKNKKFNSLSPEYMGSKSLKDMRALKNLDVADDYKDHF